MCKWVDDGNQYDTVIEDDNTQDTVVETKGNTKSTLIRMTHNWEKKKLWDKKRVEKFPIRDRHRGLDSVDQSTRDVVNDVSKYIDTISISLN